MNARAIVRTLVRAKLAEMDTIGRYGAYPGGKGYEGGLDRPLHEPNPSVANPPPRDANSPAPPAKERSGSELNDLFKGFKGSYDDFSKQHSLTPGEQDNLSIHRYFDQHPPTPGASGSSPSPTPMPAPPTPPTPTAPGPGSDKMM